MSCETLPPPAVLAGPRSGSAHMVVEDADTAARALVALRARFLLVSSATPVIDAIFEDLESVLGLDADALSAAEVSVIRPRLHSAYRRIVGVSREPNNGVRPATVAASYGLLTERSPQDFRAALGHLRRLAMSVSDLLDELLEDMP